MEQHNHHSSGESNTAEYLKFSAVLLAIMVISFFLYRQSELSGTMDFLRWFMGVFLVVFSGFKFYGYQMFVDMFSGYDLFAKNIRAYSYAYPFIEFALGLMFLLNIFVTLRLVMVIVVMGVGAAGVFNEIYVRKSGIHCACLGNIIKLPLSTVSMFENVTMFLMASFMLFV